MECIEESVRSGGSIKGRLKGALIQLTSLCLETDVLCVFSTMKAILLLKVDDDKVVFLHERNYCLAAIQIWHSKEDLALLSQDEFHLLKVRYKDKETQIDLVILDSTAATDHNGQHTQP